MAKLPPLRVCIVAEHIRPEPDNKSTIVGFLGLTPDVMIGMKNIPAVLSVTLLVLCEIVKIPGDFALEVEVFGPNYKPLLKRTALPPQPNIEVGKNAAIVIGLEGIPIMEPGKYSINLYSEGGFHSLLTFSCESVHSHALRQ
jgi:hypothetical protein